jgi:hypothetical protein
MGVQTAFHARPAASQPAVALSELMPSAIAGWAVRDLPVAESPEQVRTVEDVLAYDEVVFREYRRGADKLLVFVTRWKPGKVSLLQAALHNPDKCWPQAGLKRVDAAARTITRIGELAVIPGDYREFLAGGDPIRVAFWLTAGGSHLGSINDQNFGAGILTRIGLFIQGTKLTWQVSRGGGALCYIRLSSGTKLDTFFRNGALAPLAIALQKLGIATPIEARPSPL